MTSADGTVMLKSSSCKRASNAVECSEIMVVTTHMEMMDKEMLKKTEKENGVILEQVHKHK